MCPEISSEIHPENIVIDALLLSVLQEGIPPQIGDLTEILSGCPTDTYSSMYYPRSLPGISPGDSSNNSSTEYLRNLFKHCYGISTEISLAISQGFFQIRAIFFYLLKLSLFTGLLLTGYKVYCIFFRDSSKDLSRRTITKSSMNCMEGVLQELFYKFPDIFFLGISPKGSRKVSPGSF